MSNEFSFRELKDLCLLGLRQAALELNYGTEIIIDGPSQTLSVEGYKDFLIEKALESLREDEFAEFPLLLPFRARITGRGLAHCETLHFKQATAGSHVTISRDASNIDNPETSYIISVFSGSADANKDDEHKQQDAAEMLPASDRYVSVRDNQEPFDRLEKSLDEIVAEFAKAHGKHNSYQSDEAHWLRASIKAVKAQIDDGIVSLKLLREILVERLESSYLFFSALPGMKLLIEEAIKAIRALLELLN